MVTNGVRTEFTTKELIYFLFKKKECPQCGGHMNKEKYSEIVDGTKYSTGSDPMFMPGSTVKLNKYRYVCQSCGAVFTLHELAEGDRQ